MNGASGPVAIYGQYTLAYLQAAVKDANASGGVNGRKIVIDVLDSAASGQMITSKHPDVIYGMTLSVDCPSVAPVVRKYQTPLVSASTSETSVKPVEPYVFASQALEGVLAGPAVAFALKDLKLAKGSTYATGINPAQAAALTKVSSEVISYTAVNLATLVSQLTAKKPDVVFTDIVGPDITATAQGFQAAGLKTPIFSSLGYSGFIKLAGSDLYEVAQTNFVTPQAAMLSAGVAQVQNQQLGAQACSPPSAPSRRSSPAGLPAPRRRWRRHWRA